MFTDKKEYIQLSDKIFLFKNFFSKEEVADINFLMTKSENNSSNKTFDHEIKWFEDNKETPDIPQMIGVWNKLSDLLYPEYSIHPQLSMIINRPGEPGMFVHSDSPGRGMEEDLVSEDRWQTCCILEYGIVAYFGNFNGGEVYYPNIDEDGSIKDHNIENNCLHIKPEPGDVIIHGACFPYEHGVTEVTSGIRYSYANFVIKSNENPGTFYNYKTEEHEKRLEDLDLWLDPIIKNPLFLNGKKIN